MTSTEMFQALIAEEHSLKDDLDWQKIPHAEVGRALVELSGHPLQSVWNE